MFTLNGLKKIGRLIKLTNCGQTDDEDYLAMFKISLGVLIVTWDVAASWTVEFPGMAGQVVDVQNATSYACIVSLQH